MVNRFVNALLCTRYNLSTYANLCLPCYWAILFVLLLTCYIALCFCLLLFYSSLLLYTVPLYVYVCSFCTALEGAVALLINTADADNASLVDTEKGERVRTVDDGFQTRLMDSMYR